MDTRNISEPSPEPVIGLYSVREHKLYEFGKMAEGYIPNIITIGRARSCHIIPDDLYVSLVHCNLVRQEDGSFMLEDFDSKNGTYVNGVRIKSLPLRPGLLVTAGESEFYAAASDHKFPISARSLTSFYGRGAFVYGSPERAESFLGKSASTIRRHWARWRARNKTL